jgi:hypothetical protein
MEITADKLPAGSSCVTSAATAATTATTAATTATASAVSLRASFVHLNVAAAKVLGIQLLYCSKAFITVGHFDKSESSGTVCELVNDDLRRFYFSVGCEQALKIRFSRIKGQVSNINFDTHFLAPFEKGAPRILRMRIY